jgi:hypothetical protein
VVEESKQGQSASSLLASNDQHLLDSTYTATGNLYRSHPESYLPLCRQPWKASCLPPLPPSPSQPTPPKSPASCASRTASVSPPCSLPNPISQLLPFVVSLALRSATLLPSHLPPFPLSLPVPRLKRMLLLLVYGYDVEIRVKPSYVKSTCSVLGDRHLAYPGPCHESGGDGQR